MVSVVAVPDFDLAILGAGGDLARRKIFPALWHLHQAEWLPGSGRIVAVGRRIPEDFVRNLRRDCNAEHSPEWESFAGMISVANGVDVCGDISSLAKALGNPVPGTGNPVPGTGGTGNGTVGTGGTVGERVRVFYAALPPSLYPELAERLAAAGLVDARARIVLEKPIGRDLESYRAVNAAVARRFGEGQIFRIDHYLGKETVQNLLVTRFANTVWEPLWNGAYVDHVQISAAESDGVGGRAGYYDAAGALRDMAQNHLLQLLCLAAMEPPRSLDPDAVRDEKVKVLQSLRPLGSGDFVLGQYGAGTVGGERVPGYQDDAGSGGSSTETFAALRARVDNWRWAGTPFYLRTGKRLAARAAAVAVQFREPPVRYFAGAARANRIVIRLQPNEGVELETQSKRPGPGGIALRTTTLNLNYADSLGRLPDAYERLLLDALRGIRTLYMRNDEIEAAWGWLSPALDSGRVPEVYAAGSWGPKGADELLAGEGREWHNPGQ